MKNGLDEQYIDLLNNILENGVEKNTRNGKVLSVFGRTIKFKFKDGKFPLLTTKKMPFRLIATELIWFLKGDTSIEYLLENDCHIWDGDCFANYLKTRDRFSNKDNVKEDVVINGINGSSNRVYTKEEFINKIKTDDEFAKKWGDLGKIYGRQWRSWTKKKMYLSTDGSYENIYDDADQTVIDQIQILINDLKTNPDSRRMVVSAWAVHDLPNMVLPPCHYSFQVYTRELSYNERVALTMFEEITKEHMDELGVPTRVISLMFNMRSTDVGLGLSFNLSSYGLLLMMIAKQVNMVPDELIYNGGDVHLYLNHIEPIKEQLTREPYELPTVKISDRVVSDISEYTLDDIVLENYQSHPSIKMPLSN